MPLRSATPRNVSPPHRRGVPGRLVAGVVALVSATLLTVGALPASATPAAPASSVTPSSTSSFHGVNWADPRDNFVDGVEVPTGLSSTDSYATTYAKATAILTGFRDNLGANTVRMPVNPPTTSSATWWASYQGAIDAASDLGFKVFLAYWESASSKQGTVDNINDWLAMWSAINGVYANNGNIYYEPMNEPHGYSATDWDNLVAGWINHFPSLPKGRIVISGTGYDNSVTTQCADSRFNGTLLALHDYAFWATRSYNDWVSQIKSAIGSCASRTVMDEWGVTLNNDENYNDTSTPDNATAFLQAAAWTANNLGIGTAYWPGLRTGDGYAQEILHGSGTNLYLTNVNPTGVDRLRYSWGVGYNAASSPARTTIVGAASNRCIDVPGFATANNTQVELYDCNGGSNQAWTLTPDGELRVYNSTTCLDAYQQGTTNGTRADIFTCNGGANQKWSVNANGTITNVNSGLCLEATNAATANGTLLETSTCDGAASQHWTRK